MTKAKKTKAANADASNVGVLADCLDVTAVRVYVYTYAERKALGSPDHLKAVARVVLNNQLILAGLRVMDGPNGLFVMYPTTRADYCSAYFPCTVQLKDLIEKSIIDKYQSII